jgi:hypothetical protein
MKHTLRYCFVLLALATTGLFAEAATAPVSTTTATGHHKTIRVAKKGKKGGHKKPGRKHHRHHGKKAGK